MLEIIEIVAMLEVMLETIIAQTIMQTEILKALEAIEIQTLTTTLVKLLKKNEEKISFFFISWKKVFITFF